MLRNCTCEWYQTSFYHHFLLFQSENHGASVEAYYSSIESFFLGFTETQPPCTELAKFHSGTVRTVLLISTETWTISSWIESIAACDPQLESTDRFWKPKCGKACLCLLSKHVNQFRSYAVVLTTSANFIHHMVVHFQHLTKVSVSAH